MIEHAIDVKTPDGVADCALFLPAQSGAWPAIIMYPDIGGLRPVFRDMARRLSAEGFVVLVPNLFYRVSRLPVYRDPFQFGEEKTVKRMGEVRTSITPEGTARDASAFVKFLAADPHVKGKIGAVGYCMGGSMAFRTAGVEQGKVGAAASFHGGNLATDDALSPHRLAPNIKARLYFGFATDDKSMPPDAIERLEKALDAAAVAYEGEVYDARHGWCVKDHDVYAEKQAEHAWSKLVALFKGALG